MTSPDVLAGRLAKCTCGATQPSSPSLAFFEYQGQDSRRAVLQCKNCNYYEVAHSPEVMAKNPRLKCTTFEPHGAFEFDSYYCGHGGWD